MTDKGETDLLPKNEFELEWNSVINRLLKLAGRDDMQIDPHVSPIYLFRVCVRYGLMMVRGGYCLSSIKILPLIFF